MPPGTQRLSTTPLPKNHVMNRTGMGGPLANAVPLPLSMASSVGRPTEAMAPPTRPRSMVRRLIKFCFISQPALLGVTDEPERGAHAQLDEQATNRVAFASEGLAQLVDGGLLPRRLEVSHRL